MRRRLSALHCLRRQGEWVCAQAAADAGNASWACVENRPCPRPGRVDLEDGRADNARRDRVFRTFSRALLTGARSSSSACAWWKVMLNEHAQVCKNLCVVAADAAVFLRMSLPL